MQLVTDLHIHSHYSRATSKDMNIAALYRWGKIKGINIIGTGDFTHPEWIKELNTKLEVSDGGLYKLKEEFALEQDNLLPESCKNNFIRFIPTVEISSIYSRGGKVRRLHNVIVVPNLEVAAKINAVLEKIGNLHSDGRPILGLDSQELLRIAVDSDPDTLFIPAHIWTPWFAMFGSRSGFDTIEEAFGDLSHHIKAVESGLSSDPFMNWRLSQLDNITIVSNSDAHSAPKLGREANLINCEPSYKEIVDAIKTGDERFVGTIEFFPEEGKYHWDGHAKCKTSLPPDKSKEINNTCPICNQQFILGVEHRVEDLADRPADFKPKIHKQVEYIVPLIEIVAELEGTSVNSKKVKFTYEKLIADFGNEFDILRTLNIDVLKNHSEAFAQAITKMRNEDIYIKPGYDGIYGVVKIFSEDDQIKSPQMSLF
jgi:uncharacterized protein (TIGR00375 family)